MKDISVPNGKGGYVVVSAEEKPGQQIKDPSRQQEKFEEDTAEYFWNRVGKAATRFNDLEKAVGTEMGLTEEEMVTAKYLDLLNWQHFYPENLGGPARFAQLCLSAQEWFNKQL